LTAVADGTHNQAVRGEPSRTLARWREKREVLPSQPGVSQRATALSLWRRVSFSLSAGVRAALVLDLGFGAISRLDSLGDRSPGLYNDQASYGLDALTVLAGETPIYSPANNGREPLFIYLLARSIAFFGRTPIALRLPSAILGTVTLAATYVLGRLLFGRRAGLLTAAIAAASF